MYKVYVLTKYMKWTLTFPRLYKYYASFEKNIEVVIVIDKTLAKLVQIRVKSGLQSFIQFK